MFKEFFELECDENQINKALKEKSVSIEISHKNKMKNILKYLLSFLMMFVLH